MKKLVFVYNANSGIGSQVIDYLHKGISPKTYGCRLCGLTYGATGEKAEWKSFIKKLPLKTDFLHKDEFTEKYPKYRNYNLPAAFININNKLEVLLTKEEFEKQENLERLILLVEEKIEEHNKI